MSSDSIRYVSYPRTSPPPQFAESVVAVFRAHSDQIATCGRSTGLDSDGVLGVLRPDLQALGFEVEASKRRADRIRRPVLFGEDGAPTLSYEIDAYHAGWQCGLEVEAARAVLGNAIYRDLIQALVMVQVSTLILAVSNEYRYTSQGKQAVSHDFDITTSVADTLYAQRQFQLPYGLVVVGY